MDSELNGEPKTTDCLLLVNEDPCTVYFLSSTFNYIDITELSCKWLFTCSWNDSGTLSFIVLVFTQKQIASNARIIPVSFVLWIEKISQNVAPKTRILCDIPGYPLITVLIYSVIFNSLYSWTGVELLLSLYFSWGHLPLPYVGLFGKIIDI